MALHIGYERVEPWPFARVGTLDVKAAAARRRTRLATPPFLGAAVNSFDAFRRA